MPSSGGPSQVVRLPLRVRSADRIARDVRYLLDGFDQRVGLKSQLLGLQQVAALQYEERLRAMPSKATLRVIGQQVHVAWRPSPMLSRWDTLCGTSVPRELERYDSDDVTVFCCRACLPYNVTPTDFALALREMGKRSGFGFEVEEDDEDEDEPSPPRFVIHIPHPPPIEEIDG